VGGGAWIDQDFNAIDVCIGMPTARLSARHRGHFERALGRPLESGDADVAQGALETRRN